MEMSGQGSSLLIDSLSDSDVPDLDLVPPGSSARRKRRSPRRSRLPEISFGDSSSDAPGCSWRLWSLRLLLLSLTAGLVVLALHSLRLKDQLHRLESRLDALAAASGQAGSSSLSVKLTELESRLDALDSSSSAKSSSSAASGEASGPGKTLLWSLKKQLDGLEKKVAAMPSPTGGASESSAMRSLSDRLGTLESVVGEQEGLDKPKSTSHPPEDDSEESLDVAKRLASLELRVETLSSSADHSSEDLRAKLATLDGTAQNLTRLTIQLTKEMGDRTQAIEDQLSSCPAGFCSPLSGSTPAPGDSGEDRSSLSLLPTRLSDGTLKDLEDKPKSRKRPDSPETTTTVEPEAPGKP